MFFNYPLTLCFIRLVTPSTVSPRTQPRQDWPPAVSGIKMAPGLISRASGNDARTLSSLDGHTATQLTPSPVHCCPTCPQAPQEDHRSPDLHPWSTRVSSRTQHLSEVADLCSKGLPASYGGDSETNAVSLNKHKSEEQINTDRPAAAAHRGGK